MLKGILHPVDALQARAIGVDGIIGSNYGARQLDGTVSPMRVLPQILDTVNGMPVMIDGGFRRGSNALKVLALDASAAFCGRPFMNAAAVAEQPGTARAIQLLRDEVDQNMAMLGVTELAELPPDFLLKKDDFDAH